MAVAKTNFIVLSRSEFLRTSAYKSRDYLSRTLPIEGSLGSCQSDGSFGWSWGRDSFYFARNIAGKITRVRTLVEVKAYGGMTNI